MMQSKKYIAQSFCVVKKLKKISIIFHLVKMIIIENHCLILLVKEFLIIVEKP